jgi:hypothetical protein
MCNYFLKGIKRGGITPFTMFDRIKIHVERISSKKTLTRVGVDIRSVVWEL